MWWSNQTSYWAIIAKLWSSGWWSDASPLINSGETVSVECCVWGVECYAWGSTVQGEHQQTVGNLAEATRTVRGLECMTCWERLRKLGAFSLKKRWFSTDLTAFFSYLRRGCREERMKLFLEVISNRARDNGKNLQFRKFSLAIQKTFFTVRLVRHRNQRSCPERLVHYQWRHSKPNWTGALNLILLVLLWMEDCTTWPPNFTFQPRLFCNSRVIGRGEEGMD